VTDALRTLAALELEHVGARAAAIRAEVMLSHSVGRLPHRFTSAPEPDRAAPAATAESDGTAAGGAR
jgi:hypothetical protein